MTGKKFQQLTVVALAFPAERGKETRWRVRCVCGRELNMARKSILVAKSCNKGPCSQLVRHGLHNSKIYRTWHAMLQRCYNPKNSGYPAYGAAGILVCERWHKFELFFQDMGHKPGPGYSIDRIDGKKGYEPANCRWATTAQQNRNVSRNRWLTWQGRTMVAADWDRELGLTQGTVGKRLRKGLQGQKLFARVKLPPLHTIEGETRTVTSWAQIAGITRWRFFDRYRRGLRGIDLIKSSRSPKSGIRITAYGVTKLVSEWSLETGAQPGTIRKRLRMGYSPEEAIASGQRCRDRNCKSTQV